MKEILKRIKKHKLQEVAIKKELLPIRYLEQSHYFNSECRSLKEAIQSREGLGIIAEFKRKSPSKGEINPDVPVVRTTIGYEQQGAAAISVLTDREFFGSQSGDLVLARQFVNCPILQKDFVLDEYQVLEAKAMGADAILLIASMLTVKELTHLQGFAHRLGLEVLLETHTEEEILAYADADYDLIGINNRNLNNFEVDLAHSEKLAGMLPKGTVKIAESGIESAEAILNFKERGFQGFLIGEYLMRHSQPELQLKNLQAALNV